VSLVATPDPRALDVGLAARSCHKSMIIKYINKKNKEKKSTGRKKLMKKTKKK